MKTARAHIVVAINAVLPLDAPPEWIELIPAGAIVKGRDGRQWVNDPDGVVADFSLKARSLPLDWEHATEIKSPKGERAPAAGHIEAVEQREGGAIWGRVNWTPQGGEDVRTGAYRYISPVFAYDKNTGRIVGLISAGLVHEPNLGLKALNSAHNNHEDKQMDLKQVYEALGLVDGANEDQILAAVNKLKADREVAINKATTPDLALFVPRADHDQAVARAVNAEKTLQEERGKALNAEIDVVVKQALAEGKIAPASEEYYRAQCRKEGGLEEFRKFVGAAPKIVDGSAIVTGEPPVAKKTSLSDGEKAVCKQMGISEEEYAKSKGGE